MQCKVSLHFCKDVIGIQNPVRRLTPSDRNGIYSEFFNFVYL